MAPVTVSVIVAAHDAADSIAASVGSALEQSIRELEVLVVDDASSDGTGRIVQELAGADPRVRPIRLAENGGPGRARNRALGAARGAWLALLDADDAFAAPDRLQRLIEAADAHGAGMVADNLQLVDATDGADLGPAFDLGPADAPAWIAPAAFIESNALTSMRLGLGYLKPLVRTDLVRRHGIAYREDLRVGEDYLFYLECLLAGARWLWLGQATYRYALRPASTSRRIDREDLVRLAWYNRELLDTAEGRTPEVERALRRRRRDLTNALAHFDCLADLRAMRVLPALRRVARTPGVAPLLAASARQGLMKRLGLFRRHGVRCGWPAGA